MVEQAFQSEDEHTVEKDYLEQNISPMKDLLYFLISRQLPPKIEKDLNHVELRNVYP